MEFDAKTWPIMEAGLTFYAIYPIHGDGSSVLRLLQAPAPIEDAVQNVLEGNCTAEIYTIDVGGEKNYLVFSVKKNGKRESVYGENIAHIYSMCRHTANASSKRSVVWVAWQERDARPLMIAAPMLGLFWLWVTSESLPLFFRAWWMQGERGLGIIQIAILMLGCTFLLSPVLFGWYKRWSLRRALAVSPLLFTKRRPA